MAYQIKKIIVNEKGVTLTEVIASFVILVIVLFSFFTLFVNTAKTTKSSERIVDATYVAQTEMEKVYNASTNGVLNVATLTKPTDPTNPEDSGLGYTAEPNSTTIFTKTAKSNFKVTLTLKNRDVSLKSVVIQVNSNSDNKQKALMEKLIVWKGN
ncbi:type IV pilus modification PilV family protein [Rummeliibacillus stabekisii]|uniref:type IV pilus modification PilV family protein n=1 Tax=Rummeliibacillus stabekisii TaxID=241244 RepID=UPI001172EC8D|nr:hypothetical protein [Rummeliibacillus stabekisii]MBB5168849.1 Tfp pilus assembly protein PilV [Rummeliibacillus stabekisii]GEL05007.1 hypothetical protein RST01_16340 [Rummeliibacillus stabekisii]